MIDIDPIIPAEATRYQIDLWDKSLLRGRMYCEARDWLKATIPKSAGGLDFSTRSWINGLEYAGYVWFCNTEDYLVFKLRFGELIKFQ